MFNVKGECLTLVHYYSQLFFTVFAGEKQENFYVEAKYSQC